jgi:hypothetical protein
MTWFVFVHGGSYADSFLRQGKLKLGQCAGRWHKRQRYNQSDKSKTAA